MRIFNGIFNMIVFLATACLFIAPFCLPLNAGTLITGQKKLISLLYNEGNYFQCIAETERLVQWTAPDDRAPYDYFIAINYYRGYQYSSAIYTLQKSTAARGQLHHSILVSQSYRWQHEYSKAISALKQYNYAELSPEHSDRLFVRRLEIQVDASDYTGALEEIKQAENIMGGDKRTSQLRSSLMDIQHQQVSPAVTALFSAAVPGLGQARVKRYSDALLSLTAVALLGSGTYYLLKNDHMAAGATLGFFLAVTYAGNVYGAYNSALRYNRDTHYRWKETFRRQFIPAYNPDDHLKRELFFP